MRNLAKNDQPIEYINRSVTYHSPTDFIYADQICNSDDPSMPNSRTGRRPKSCARLCVNKVPQPMKRYMRPFSVLRSATDNQTNIIRWELRGTLVTHSLACHQNHSPQ